MKPVNHYNLFYSSEKIKKNVFYAQRMDAQFKTANCSLD